MAALNNKIDFVVLVSANQANVNGDPLNGNRPRTDYSGYGEMSDVCIKRKIRNRMQDLGNDIFVQSADRSDDGCKSLSERASSNIKTKDINEYAKEACEKWLDVRSFGQVFAFKSKDSSGVSVGVRGPVDYTVVNGKITVRDGRLVTIDEPLAAEAARKKCAAFLRHNGTEAFRPVRYLRDKRLDKCSARREDRILRRGCGYYKRMPAHAVSQRRFFGAPRGFDGSPARLLVEAQLQGRSVFEQQGTPQRSC